MRPRTLGCLAAPAILLLSAAAIASNMGFAWQRDIGSGGANLSFLSVPVFFNPSNDGVLCWDPRFPTGSTTIAAVWSWNEATATFVRDIPGTGSNFSLTEGIAHGIVNVSGQTITWKPRPIL